MLIDHADAELASLLRRGDLDLAPVHENAAAVGAMKSDQAFDQRRLAGAVFAEQRMHGPRANRDRDPVQRGEIAEALAQFEGVERQRPMRRGGRLEIRAGDTKGLHAASAASSA